MRFLDDWVNSACGRAIDAKLRMITDQELADWVNDLYQRYRKSDARFTNRVRAEEAKNLGQLALDCAAGNPDARRQLQQVCRLYIAEYEAPGGFAWGNIVRTPP